MQHKVIDIDITGKTLCECVIANRITASRIVKLTEFHNRDFHSLQITLILVYMNTPE